MKCTVFAVLLAFSLVGTNASAQRAPDTLGKIKAAKAINVGFSGDSLPFSFVGDGGGFIVKSDAPINRFTDLNGKKVAVIKGTTTEQRLNAAMKARLVNARVTTITDAAEGVPPLESGAVDAFALTQIYVGGEIDGIFGKWLGKLGRPSGLLAAMYLLNAIPE